MYGKTSSTESVKEARKDLLNKKSRDLENIPPTQLRDTLASSS